MTETPIATDDYEPGTCKQCGEKVPPTKPRSDEAFAGFGRPRAFCDARCRKRFSRAKMPTRYPDNGNGRREGLRERRVSIVPKSSTEDPPNRVVRGPQLEINAARWIASARPMFAGSVASSRHSSGAATSSVSSSVALINGYTWQDAHGMQYVGSTIPKHALKSKARDESPKKARAKARGAKSPRPRRARAR